MKKLQSLMLLLLICVLAFVGCSKQSDSNISSKSEMDFASESSPAPQSTGTPLPGVVQNRKIIQRHYYTLESELFQETLDTILDTLQKNDGYVQNLSQSGRGTEGDYYNYRTANMVLRVPVGRINEFLKEFAGNAVIIQNNLETEDVTGEFFDKEAHLKTLAIQEERLLKLLEQSVKLEDMIVLESRLSEIRYEIENLQGTLNRLSQLVDYVVVSIELQEVRDVLSIKTKNNYIDRALNTFMDSVSATLVFLEDISLLLIGLIPVIIFIIPFFLVYKWLVKKHPQYRIFKKKSLKAPISKDNTDSNNG